MLYVDDMLVTCRDMAKISELKRVLSKEFEMENLGEAKKILGIEIRSDWEATSSGYLKGHIFGRFLKSLRWLMQSLPLLLWFHIMI